jgi:hypothetical protein
MSKKSFILLVLFSLLFLGICQVEGRNIGSVPSGVPKFNAWQSNCHDNPTYPDPDSIIITVSGDDIVVMHKDAFYNCCYEISVEVVQNGNVFNLYEHESGNPCWCMCYFDVTTTIYDLEAGTYTINVYNAQDEYVGGGAVTIHRTMVPLPVFK